MKTVLKFPEAGRERDVRPDPDVSPLETSPAWPSHRADALQDGPTFAELAKAVTKLTAEVELLRAQSARTNRTLTGLIDMCDLHVRKFGDVVKTVVEMRQHLMGLTHRLRRLRRP